MKILRICAYLSLIAGIFVPFVARSEIGISRSASGQEILLTNADIVQMVSSGLSPEIIKAKIANSKCQFDTTPKALADLKAANVGDSVIVMMVSAGPPAPIATPVSGDMDAHKNAIAKEKADETIRCSFCVGIMISNFDPSRGTTTDNWLSRNQSEYLKERSKKVKEGKVDRHFWYPKYKENADFIIVWSQAVGTRAYTTYTPQTSTSTTSVSGDINATAHTTSTTYQAQQAEHQFVNIVATVYSNDGTKKYETFHQGNFRWSKPDKDCLEDALNYLHPKQ
jgi:hypothetical protein